MLFVHHDTGDYTQRSSMGYATRASSQIRQFASIDDKAMNEYERLVFGEMLESNLSVLTSGTHVYQIRKELP